MLFLLTVFESVHELKKYRFLTAFLCAFFLFLFTGLRWDTGTDWISYKGLFDNVDFNFDELFFIQIYSFEFGYVLLNIFIKFFVDNYTVLLLVDSLIAVGIVYLFIRKFSPNPNISLFVFYNAFFVAQFMGSNRRIIALGAALFVFYYVHEKKFGKYLIWQTIAFLFHRSSLMLAFAWFIPKKRFTAKQILVILFICLLIGIPQLPLKLVGLIGQSFSAGGAIVDRLIFYSENSETTISENTNPLVLMTLSAIKRGVFLCFYLYVIKLNKSVLDTISDYFLNIYVVGFAVYLLFNGSAIFQMFSTYFTFIEIVLIGRFWSYADKRSKLIFLSVLFFYGFFQLLSSLNAYPELYLPYKTFLDA